MIEGFRHNIQAVILILIVVALFIVRYIVKRTDKAKWHDGDAVIGLKPISIKYFWEYVGKKNFSVLSPWFAPVSILNPFQGVYKGYDVCIFHLGLADGSKGGASQTAVHVKSNKIDLPNFLLKPSGFLRKLIDFFRSEDYSFPSSPSLRNKYYLKSDNEARIRSLFQPQVVNFFQEHEDITIESNGNAIISFKYRDQAKRGNYEVYLDRAINLVALLNGVEVTPQLKESFACDKSEVRTQKYMSVALSNLVINAFIIGVVYYQIGGSIAYIISGLFILESIGFLLFAMWKKKGQVTGITTTSK